MLDAWRFPCPVCGAPLGWLKRVTAPTGQERQCLACGVRLEANDPPWLTGAAIGTLLVMGPLAVSLVIYQHFALVIVPLGVGLVAALGLVITLVRKWTLCPEQEPGYCNRCGTDNRDEPRDANGARRCRSCGTTEAAAE